MPWCPRRAWQNSFIYTPGIQKLWTKPNTQKVLSKVCMYVEGGLEWEAVKGKLFTDRVSHPVFYGDLAYKLVRVRGLTNSIASGTKNSKTPFDVDSIWPRDHREDNLHTSKNGCTEHENICIYLYFRFSIHIEQRHVNITVLFNFWFQTVNNCDTYCVDNLNFPPNMFFVPNIIFSGVRIFTRNIYLHCTDISDTGVQMFLRTNDKK